MAVKIVVSVLLRASCASLKVAVTIFSAVVCSLPSPAVVAAFSVTTLPRKMQEAADVSESVTVSESPLGMLTVIVTVSTVPPSMFSSHSVRVKYMVSPVFTSVSCASKALFVMKKVAPVCTNLPVFSRMLPLLVMTPPVRFKVFAANVRIELVLIVSDEVTRAVAVR